MKKLFLLLLSLTLVSMYGCTFKVKTPIIADYQKFNNITSNNTNSDIELLSGSPQGSGLHMFQNRLYDLKFYYGFIGDVSLSTVKCDSGTAFITYGDGNKLLNLLYFTSKYSGPEISLDKSISIKKIAGSVVLDRTRINQIYDVLGIPDYTGKRMSVITNTIHNVAFYDASQLQEDGAIKEKWILFGYDDKEVVQDIIWVSSNAEDISEFGKIEPQQITQLSRLTVAGFIPILEPQAMSTGFRIDPVQVEALIRKNPLNIKEFKALLGNPSALGIKSLKNETPLILSNWSYSNIQMKGQEQRYLKKTASEQAEMSTEEIYMIMDISQTRLMVGHDQEGSIKEIMWVKPLLQL